MTIFEKIFGEDIYSLGIALPPKLSDKMYDIILSIAEKEPSIMLDKKLTSRISVKPEFHITLGVLHPESFQTNGKMFKHILEFMNTHPQVYSNLMNLFKGQCTIAGIGYDKNNIQDSQVVWVPIISEQIPIIRQKIHEMLNLAGVEEKNFQFTDPHITLFFRTGKGDLHGIHKLMKQPLHLYLKDNDLSFNFNTVCFYKRSKVIYRFGKTPYDGRASKKFKQALKDKLAKKASSQPQYNWGNLFRDPTYRAQAMDIKKTILKDGYGGLARIGFKGQEIGKIRKLINP